MELHKVGDNNNCVPGLNDIVTSRDYDLALTENSCDKHVILEFKLRKRNARNRRVFLDDKLRRLYLTLDDIVKRLNVAADGVFHCTDIPHYHIGGDVLGVDYGIKVKLLDYRVKVDTVYLGDELSLACALCKKRKQDIFLVKIGKSRKCAAVCHVVQSSSHFSAFFSIILMAMPERWRISQR